MNKMCDDGAHGIGVCLGIGVCIGAQAIPRNESVRRAGICSAKLLARAIFTGSWRQLFSLAHLKPLLLLPFGPINSQTRHEETSCATIFYVTVARKGHDLYL